MKLFISLITISVIFIICNILNIKIDDRNSSGNIDYITSEHFFCKTWDIALIENNNSSEIGATPYVYSLTIDNKELAKKADYAMKNQKDVSIHFEKRMNFCDEYGHVTSIDIINNTNSNDSIPTKIEELSTKINQQQQQIDALKSVHNK
jgi:hypothetical protein